MRIGRWMVVAAGLAMVLSGCGAPSPGTTTHFDPAQVPFGLLSGEPTNGTGEGASDPSGPAVWFVRGDKLVATPASATTGTPLEQTKTVIQELQSGPTSQQQDAGLSNALPAAVDLDVRYVVSGVANVRYEAAADSRPRSDTPLMTGQIVLTLTSVPGVEAVIFDNGRRQVEAPLPGGALTDEPVTAADYQTLVAP